MTDRDAMPQPAARRPSRWGLYLPFTVLALLCLGWTAAWFYAAHKAGAIADAFIAREGERGREWMCPDRRVSGFPFRIEIACNRPQLVLKGEDSLRNEARLGALALHARVVDPGHIIALFSPPFIMRGANGDVELTWKSGRASLKAGLSGIGEMSAEFLDLQLNANRGDLQAPKAAAKSVEMHVRRAPGDKPATDLVARLDALAFEPLDQLTGNPEPVRVELQVSAPGLEPNPRRRWQDLLETWRQGGHKARIVVLKANKGQATIDLAGEVGLDALHRPEGNLQGRARGLDAVLGRLARRGSVDLGGILGKLGGQQGLPVAMTMQNGFLRYGPFPLAELRPLY